MLEIVLRLVLAGVLAGAALAKLRSPRSTRAALATFGFAEGALRDLAWGALVAVELALAVGVAIGSSTAAYAAAALMALLALLMVGALLRGRGGAPCACFGARSTVSPLSVLRDLALAGGFALLPSLPSEELSTDQWLGLGLGVALLACGALAIAVLALAREVGMLRLRLGADSALEVAGEGPAPGSASPELLVRIPLGRARIALAVFTSEGCRMCQALSPAIESLAREPEVAVGVFDEASETELWSRLAVPGSPFAIVLDLDATVLATGTFNNLAQLESVLATAERRRASGEIPPPDQDRRLREALDKVPAGA